MTASPKMVPPYHAKQSPTGSNDQNTADEADRHSRQGNEIRAREVLGGY